MQPSPYPEVNDLLEHLLGQLRAILGEKLVGLYLYGSLVAGDFDIKASDVDLLAALTDDLTEADFQTLHHMHTATVQQRPRWYDRLEIAYLSLRALRTFKTKDSPIGIISPGEPFHIKSAGRDWLLNWHMVRGKGRTLYGPPPATLIDPITSAEFVSAVKLHVAGWREYIDEMQRRPAQAYAILTLCRALYSCQQGEQASKPQAARWAAAELPEWAGLIEQALVWRQGKEAEGVDHEATYAETKRFVLAMIERIEGM